MWSKTKKHLESLICSSLKDRVEIHCSNYRMHDGIGRTYITVDGKEVYNIGKRTLLNMKESIGDEEEIVKYFYKLRSEAEGIE